MAMQIFERKEKKYILSQEKYGEFLERISAHMKEDKYGLHTICSLYYDTKNYDLIKRSSEKPTYKEKLESVLMGCRVTSKWFIWKLRKS